MADKIDWDDWRPAVAADLSARIEAGIALGTGLLAATATFAQDRPIPKREFDAATRADIEAKYLALAPSGDDIGAESFATLLERFAEGVVDIDAARPPEQDVREERLRSLGATIGKLADQLKAIDSRALAYALHEVDKAISEDGKAQAATDPVRAFILAGLLRDMLDPLLPKVGLAVLGAAKTLPIAERKDVDSRLQMAQGIKDVLLDHGLAFEVTDAGFAAHCFRAVFELANPGESNRARYWLEKVAAS